MAKKRSPTVSLRLKEILDEKGLSPDDLEKICQDAGAPVTRATIYNLLKPNVKGVYFTTLTALCRGLGVEPCDLIIMR